jgi:DGQHR domain-containing protein
MISPQLSPTDGHLLSGVQIDEHRFLARVPAKQMFQFAPDPRQTEDPKKLAVDADLRTLFDLRKEVQRMFVGAKEKNVPSYAAYIVRLNHNEQEGLTPVIVLYSSKILQTSTDKASGMGYIQIPWDLPIVAVDGETQLAARHEARSISPKTADEFVPVYVCHGKPLTWARQTFHDLNVLGVQPNAALSISMDARDAATKMTRDVEQHVSFFTGRINKITRQLKRDDQDVLTMSALRGACVTFAAGIAGVQYGTKPVPIKSTDIERISAHAYEWFNAVTKLLGPAIEDRNNSLAGAPSVFAAIGAMGRELGDVENLDERQKRTTELLDRLRGVDWTKGKQWEGIAGKFTPKGKFAVGGSKETAYPVYAALNDPTSEGYRRIRSREVANGLVKEASPS